MMFDHLKNKFSLLSLLNWKKDINIMLLNSVFKILRFNPVENKSIMNYDNYIKLINDPYLVISSNSTEILHQVLYDYFWKPEFHPNPGNVVFDIGANTGMYSLIVGRMTNNQAFVHSFEPLPESFEQLKMHLLLNQINHITINRVACGDFNGEIDLFKIFNNTQSTINEQFVKGVNEKTSFKAKCITLDNYIQQHSISKIDLIKIDVEGSELNILRGAKNTLKITIKIIMEYHTNELKEECSNLLENNGFRKICEGGSINLGILYFSK